MKYYSEKLDKIFDAEEDLKAAEKEHEEAEAKKAEAKALVQKEAKVVEDAFKARNVAKREFNERIAELYKTRNAALEAAYKEFDEAYEEAAKTLNDAELAYDKALKEFQANHKEGYRLTLKDDDNVVVLTSAPEHDRVADYRKVFDKWFEDFAKFRW